MNSLINDIINTSYNQYVNNTQNIFNEQLDSLEYIDKINEQLNIDDIDSLIPKINEILDLEIKTSDLREKMLDYKYLCTNFYNKSKNFYDMCSKFKSFYESSTYIKYTFGTETLRKLIDSAKLSNNDTHKYLEIKANKINSVLWPGFVEKIQESIKLDHLSSDYELVPSKLIIYQNDCFSKYIETSEYDKCVGTVFYNFSGNYNGGIFIVKDDNNRNKYSSNTSISRCVAIYGNVFHEVTKVTDGTKISLIFDIKNKNIEIKQNPTKSILSFVKNLNVDSMIIIGMNHEYSRFQLNNLLLMSTDLLIYNSLITEYNVSLKRLVYHNCIYDDDTDNICGENTLCILSNTTDINEALLIFKVVDTKKSLYNDYDDHNLKLKYTKNLYMYCSFIITKKEHKDKDQHQDQ